MNDTIVTRRRRNAAANLGDIFVTSSWLSIHCVSSARKPARSHRLVQKGFSAIEREYDEPDTCESGLGGLGATPSVEELQDEAEAWAEREMRRLKLENENAPDYSNRGPYGGDDASPPAHAWNWFG